MVSFKHHISELRVSGFGRPMQLSKMRPIGCEGWLYTCVMALRHIDSAIISVDVVNS